MCAPQTHTCHYLLRVGLIWIQEEVMRNYMGCFCSLPETWHTQGECFHEHWIKWCFQEKEKSGFRFLPIYISFINTFPPVISKKKSYFPFVKLSWETSSNTFALWNTSLWKSFQFWNCRHQLSNMEGRSCLAGENLDIMNSNKTIICCNFSSI